MTTDLKTVESGQPGLYILGWPVPGHPSPHPAKEAYVIPVMCRPGGVLLAVPLDFLPQEVLAQGQNAVSATELVGPSVTIEVPAIEEDDEGAEKDAGLSLALMLVDFASDVDRSLSEFQSGAYGSTDPMFLARCSGDSSIIQFADDSGIRVDAGRVGLEGSLLLCFRRTTACGASSSKACFEEGISSYSFSGAGASDPESKEGHKCSLSRSGLSPISVVAGCPGSTSEDARATGEVGEDGLDRSCGASGSSLPAALWKPYDPSIPVRDGEVFRDDWASPSSEGHAFDQQPRRPSSYFEVLPGGRAFVEARSGGFSACSARPRDVARRRDGNGHLPADSGYDGFGGPSGRAVGSLRSSKRFRILVSDLKRINEEGEAPSRPFVQALKLPAASIPASLQEVPSFRTGSSSTCRLEGKGPVHQVYDQAWRFCRPAGIGLHHMAGCPHSRLHAGQRREGGSGNHCPDPMCFGSSMPGWEQVGCCFPPGSFGGASSRSFQWARGSIEPKDEGLFSFGPSSLGDNHLVIRKRNGFDRHSQVGSLGWGGCQEGREQGCCTKKETEIPQKTKRGQRRMNHHRRGSSGSLGVSPQAMTDKIGSGVSPHVLDLWCGDHCNLSDCQPLPGPPMHSSVDDRVVVDGGKGNNPLCLSGDLGSGISSCKAPPESFTSTKNGRRSHPRGKHSSDDEKAFDPSANFEVPHPGADDPWKELQSFSFAIWRRRLLSMGLHTRTAFAAFLKTTLHASRSSEVAPANALFPLPIPKPGVFTVLPSRCASQKRRRIAFDRAFHIIVCAVNFLHADCSFPSVELMRKEPSKVQKKLLWNLRSLVRAFGNSGDTFDVPQSGRRSIHLLAGLADLSDFVTRHGLSSEPYHRGFQGVVKTEEEEKPLDLPRVSPNLDLADQLIPYRPLQPDRLKLSGKANWDPCPFLGDAFLLPYREPALLVWTKVFNWDDIPDLDREDPNRVLELAKVWDRNGLLAIRPGVIDEEIQPSCLRVFNCLKSSTHDRQIGDRRGRNQIE